MKIEKKNLKVHFIGICGVSMSALAKYLFSVGFIVSGSDLADGEIAADLKKNGIRVFIGHDEKNVIGKEVVVYNDAIKPDNVELKAAEKEGAFIVRRAELLKMVSENFGKRIGIAGCHGKTTACCMIAHVFKRANLRFTAHIGGFDTKLGNVVLSGSKIFLSEVCEFKKNLTLFDADLAVCLNAEADHLDCYENSGELKKTYFNYITRGYKSIICVDDKTLSEYDGDNAVTFGLKNGADFTAKNIREKNGRYSFDLVVYGVKTERINLRVYGKHNIENALATSAVAFLCGVSSDKIKKGLEDFEGVKRRFEKIGEINGAEVIADYAHHPTEIKEAVETAEEMSKGKVYVVFQPHTYSRTVFLKEQFVSVLGKIQNLIIYKTFPAREEYIEGGSGKDLADILGNADYIEDAKEIVRVLQSKAKKKDLVLILGAGDLYFPLKKLLNGL